MATIERCANAIAAVLCECCTVEEIEDTLAQINPADWNRAAEKCLEAANYRGAVDLLREARELLPHAAFAGWRHDERNGLVERIDAALGGR